VTRHLVLLPALLAATAVAEPWPAFEASNLVRGREVWLGTCEGCHGIGVAGAPVASDHVAWEPRVRKGRDTLYRHAIEGFFGEGGTMMPGRGGNEELSDSDIRAAVDYMVEVAQSNQLPTEDLQ